MSDQITPNRRDTLLGAAALVTASAFGSFAEEASAAMAQPAATSIDTRIGKLEFTREFPGGYPTKAALERLYDERDFQRAVQAYLWAIPMVSFGGFKRVFMEPASVADGVFMPVTKYASLSHFLTPNATTPYIVTVFNLGVTGPFVFEIPAGPTAGFVNDLWQRQ